MISMLHFVCSKDRQRKVLSDVEIFFFTSGGLRYSHFAHYPVVGHSDNSHEGLGVSLHGVQTDKGSDDGDFWRKCTYKHVPPAQLIYHFFCIVCMFLTVMFPVWNTSHCL